MSQGEELCLLSPPCFGSGCAGKPLRKDAGAHLVWATLWATAQPPSCYLFLPLLPSHQSSVEGLEDFSAFLGECEIFALVRSRG